MIQGEEMYVGFTSDDFDKIGWEIGEHFGHSSEHSVAFEGMRERLRQADKELQHAGYCHDHPALAIYRPAADSQEPQRAHDEA